jgi:HAD superfamily hydrolase (TIGR01549 family)
MVVSDSFDVFVFDLDGVLIDSFDLMLKSLRNLKIKYNLTFNENNIFELQGLPLHEVFEKMGIDQKYKSDYVNFARNNLSQIKLFSNVQDVLKGLAMRKKNMYIHTGKDISRTKQILKHYQIAEYFNDVFCSDGPHEPKPSTQVLNLIKAKYPNKNIVFFGDSVYDYLASKVDGVNFFLINAKIEISNYFQELL